MSATAKPSRDVAAEITNLIIKKLEEGVPPWSRPWRVQGSGGRPLRLSIGVQKGPPIGVQKGPPSSSCVTGMAGVPFALVAA